MKTLTHSVVPIWFLATAVLMIGVFVSTAAGRDRILLDYGWHLGFSDTGMSVPPLRHSVAIKHWRWRPARAPEDEVHAVGVPKLESPDSWHAAQTGSTDFHNQQGYAWFRTVLPSMPGGGRYVVFENNDSNVWLYLNGRLLHIYRIAAHGPFGASLDRAWHHKRPNILSCLVSHVGDAGAIPGPVMLGYTDLVTVGPAARHFHDSTWKAVQIPNDYIVDGKYNPKGHRLHGYLPVEPAWYRKTFKISATARGKMAWLYFEGVYRDAQVYINGHYLGEHQSGFTSFRFNVTRWVRFGKENTVSVLVNPCDFEGWWYEGGGIYRHVWLIIKHQLHVTRFGTFVISHVPGAITADTAHGDIATAALTIKTTVHNDRRVGASFTLGSQVFDPAGKIVVRVTTQEFLKPHQCRTFIQKASIRRAALWSLGHRNLYRLHTVLATNGTTIDDRNTTFGIRTLRFSPNRGFFLNGKHVELKGTCDHQDFAALGIAVPDNILFWRVKKLRAMGSNAIRTAHNPPAPEFLDACDRLGMLVMEENRHLGDTYNRKAAPGTPYSRLANLRRMILRDRNHPSVIMWSMCNEEGLVVTREGAAIFAAMRHAVHKIDPTRPVMCAQNPTWPEFWGKHLNARLVKVEDIQGINYNPQLYSAFHAAHPRMPVVASECTSGGLAVRGIYPWNSAPDYGKRYDANFGWPWEAWRPIADHPFVMGGFVWTGFDYRGEPNPSNFPDVSSNFGLMDMCGFPKDTYYYFKAAWDAKPMVHIIPGNWNWPGKQGRGLRLRIYSNCSRVQLFVNGKSVGGMRKIPPLGWLGFGWKGHWMVFYQPGTIEARGYDHGQWVATDTIETAGKPAKLVLRSPMRYVRANGEDVALVDVAVEDASGRVNPNADNMLHFAVSGPGHIAGVCNGNSHCIEPNLANYHRAFNGLCQLEVRAQRSAGLIGVTVSARGLKSGHLEIPCRKVVGYSLPPRGTY